MDGTENVMTHNRTSQHRNQNVMTHNRTSQHDKSERNDT